MQEEISQELLWRLALLRAHRGNPQPLRRVLTTSGSVSGAKLKIRHMPADVRQALLPLCDNNNSSTPTSSPDARFLAFDDAAVIAADDPRYPPLLGEIREAPPLLFCRGDVTALLQPQIAIVGSRNASPAGLALARAFAADLAAAGFVITSGMALGIDAMAHEGALAAGGKTIAVLGCGADVVYPKRHLALAERIRRQGCIVSEFLPGTPPLAPHFPLRNRIISALVLGVLVVEAAPDSGSLITARFAAEQGREVFAIPGSIHAPTARGCHQLIREGATLVETSAQLMEALTHFALTPPAQMNLLAAEPDPAKTNLSAEEQRLLKALSPAGSRVDELVLATGFSAAVASTLLSSLAIRGQVHAMPGGLWQPA
jgi:DNA processing protein